ncbi:hypothetical protein G5714_007487 [Onychostoma macrolepis]|uniref:Peptidase A2 domain-containing protein n=1 Tax=Onychostoma macrolepis TaxID=369639 RepID=A0A7J6CT25_9TELE|nr:hypothetical protein G5714_007487 [Onychostoma macrolepis]
MTLISMDTEGYSGRQIRSVSNSGKNVLFLVPLQEEMDTQPLPYNSAEFAKMPKVPCVTCNTTMPLQMLALHAEECKLNSNVSCVHICTNSKKFYLSIIIERHIKVEALLDTGADITLMSAELLQEVQEGAKRTNRTLKLQRCELNLQAYSHTGLRLKHVAPIHLTVGSMDLIHPIYVSPLKTYPLLIGKDLLNRFEPLIDFKHLKMWTQVREPLPCQSVDSNELQCQVTDTGPNSRNDGAVSEPRPEPSSSSKDQDPLLCSLQEPEPNTGPLRIMTAIDVHGTSVPDATLALETIRLLLKDEWTEDETSQVSNLCLDFYFAVPNKRSNKILLFQQLLTHAVLGRAGAQLKQLKKGLKDTGVWPLISCRPDVLPLLFPRESEVEITPEMILQAIQWPQTQHTEDSDADDIQPEKLNLVTGLLRTFVEHVLAAKRRKVDATVVSLVKEMMEKEELDRRQSQEQMQSLIDILKEQAQREAEERERLLIQEAEAQRQQAFFFYGGPSGHHEQAGGRCTAPL